MEFDDFTPFIISLKRLFITLEDYFNNQESIVRKPILSSDKTKVLSARIPENWFFWLKEHSIHKNLTFNDLMKGIIRDYLSCNVDNYDDFINNNG